MAARSSCQPSGDTLPWKRFRCVFECAFVVYAFVVCLSVVCGTEAKVNFVIGKTKTAPLKEALTMSKL